MPLQAVEAVAQHIGRGGSQARKGRAQGTAFVLKAGVGRGLLLGDEEGGAGVLDARWRHVSVVGCQLHHEGHAAEQLCGAAGLEDHAVCRQAEGKMGQSNACERGGKLAVLIDWQAHARPCSASRLCIQAAAAQLHTHILSTLLAPG